MGLRIAVVVALAAVFTGSSAASRAGLHGAVPCPDVTGYTCSTLDVPLDWSGKRPGRLHLRVGAANNVHAPRGVLLVIAGGPGQPAVPALARFVPNALGAELRDYRIVVYDQRGTGAGALNCQALQSAMGSSDLTPPPATAVRSCAAKLGDRRQFFGTDDVVADMDALRRALGVKTWTLDGISYGTYVGERYALAHPDRVKKLVLDSVVPHVREWDVGRDEFRAVRRVLGRVCGRCVGDLAAVVRKTQAGPQLFDALTFLSIADPTYRNLIDVPQALHDARSGNISGMSALLQTARTYQFARAEELDQGLHASALCADWRWPWGTSTAPVGGREQKLARAAAKVNAYPFDRATVTGNGFVRQCLPWAPTAATPLATGKVTVPTLLVEGANDISTSVEWAREELALTTHGKLVVVPGAGHSVQSRAVSNLGRIAVERFLNSP
ncbi:MAG TPA: alpha/beta hydrolase [Gaiellaceae bacterium]